MAEDNLAAAGRIDFSLEAGIVRASWPGRDGSIELGDYETVSEAMRDFLAECAIGDRLTSGKSS